MIFELLVLPFFTLAEFIISLFPVIEAPAGFVDGLGQAFGLVRGLSIFIPVDTFFTVFGIMLTVYAIQFIVSISSWIFRKIPSVS